MLDFALPAEDFLFLVFTTSFSPQKTFALSFGPFDMSVGRENLALPPL